MNPLAQQIYDILKKRVPCAPAQELITYKALVAQLRAQHGHRLGVRSKPLHAALGEVVIHCRALKLPALAAIVVRKDTWVPGPGYYPLAHPHIPQDDWALLMQEWGSEAVQVRQTQYP